MIVIMDCVMTFFGSTANDAAFNAFVTDNTNENNRSKVESVLSVLPLLALIAVIVVAGMFVDVGDGDVKRWDIFFYIFGGITLVIGIISFFLAPKDVVEPNKNVDFPALPQAVKAADSKGKKISVKHLVCHECLAQAQPEFSKF